MDRSPVMFVAFLHVQCKHNTHTCIYIYIYIYIYMHLMRIYCLWARDAQRVQHALEQARDHVDMPQSEDAHKWEQQKHEQAWRALVREQDRVMQATLSAEATSILHLKKAVLLLSMQKPSV